MLLLIAIDDVRTDVLTWDGGIRPVAESISWLPKVTVPPYRGSVAGVWVGTGVGVGVAVPVGVGVAVTVDMGVAVTVDMGVAATVDMGVAVTVDMGVAVTVDMGVAVTVDMGVAATVGGTVAMGGVAILASATDVGGGAVPGVAGDANPAVGVGAGAGPPPSQAATTSVRAVARAAAARRERVKRNVQLRQADSNRRTPWTLCPPAERWSRSRCAPRSGLCTPRLQSSHRRAPARRRYANSKEPRRAVQPRPFRSC